MITVYLNSLSHVALIGSVGERNGCIILCSDGAHSHSNVLPDRL